jgi:tRNA(fMet)-specific endonuclease VapC
VPLVLDTNALLALVEGDVALDRVITGENRLAIPAIVLGEYLFGIRHSRNRARYEQWLRERLALFMVLNADSETARAYADIRSELRSGGKRIPMNDHWVAAIARQYDIPLITRDPHFGAVQGLRLLSW